MLVNYLLYVTLALYKILVAKTGLSSVKNVDPDRQKCKSLIASTPFLLDLFGECRCCKESFT